MRKGENKTKINRSGRFYSLSDNWYFSVRETTDQGPYFSKPQAENSLKEYLYECKNLSLEKINQAAI